MSFFGFDTTLPRDKPQPSSSRGVFDSHDPFAGLSRSEQDNGDVLDFEDTYDGLGQHLQESGDAFNDDTFGGEEPVTQRGVGRDFDFSGETAKIRDTLLEEQALHHARQPMQQAHAAARSGKTGYEAYKQPGYIPKLEADASIWGTAIGKKTSESTPPPVSTGAGPRMMSLEEVEAAMRAQAKPTPPPPQDVYAQTQGLKDMLGLGGSLQPMPPVSQDQQRAPQILQRPQQPPFQQDQFVSQPSAANVPRAPQVLKRQHDQHHVPEPSHGQVAHLPQQAPFQQSQGQLPSDRAHTQRMQPPRGPAQMVAHNRGPSYNGPPITQAQQLMQLDPTSREVYLAEEAKRAKRNHKIFLLSKHNGVMTPQDKNFVTRIQLQQLLTATGGVDNEPGSEEQLAEDFYYQVYAQIRGPPRSGPGQPLNQFAQTYLFQTGSRYGYGRSRHHPRGVDNHVQRMEQQVARAVEAAKARPKNKSLVVEGSLGKIAFSNSKTPRPLLSIKRQDSEARQRMAHRPVSIADRKTTLRNIEHLYSTLMRLEDHERNLPPPPNEESPPEAIEGHMRWRSTMQDLNRQLWDALKVMEPVQPNHASPHPFIQILAHSKGKKAIPRVFRHLDDQQRLTMLTLIMIHLDILDVVRDAYPPADNSPLPARVKEEVELFSQAVIPPLFSYINEAPLGIVIGLLGLVLDRVHVQALVRTKIGLAILTMLISRAELVKQSIQSTQASAGQHADDWAQWTELYGRLFDTIEPVLPYIFPLDTSVSASDDVHVWQFLAAMGVGASPDQQQRLVLGVKDRVMETVTVSKTLPEELGNKRLADVNLFMRAIGLDVDLLVG